MRAVIPLGMAAAIVVMGLVPVRFSDTALAERAQAAIDTLQQRLLKRLLHEYQQGGAERGVRVCAEVAQVLTEQVGAEQGVHIRRVSRKYRNPKNAPDQWEESVLRQWEEQLRRGEPIEEVAHWDGSGKERTYRLMRPIRIAMPLCLECHGQHVQPSVLRLLRQKYPRDNARGYKLGDLRGAFSVRIPSPEN